MAGPPPRRRGTPRAGGLTDGLFGPGRLARWRRSVLRRALAAVLAALAVVLTGAAARRSAQPEPRVHVVTLVRTVPAGARLTASDVTSATTPRSAVPPSALTSTAEVVGRRVVGPVLAGEVLTRARLVPGGTGGGYAGPAADGVVVHLLSDDPDALDLVGPGDRVTLYPGGGGPVLARGATVVAVDAVREGTSPAALIGTAAPRGLVLALDPAVADRLFATLRPDSGPPVVSVVRSPGGEVVETVTGGP